MPRWATAIKILCVQLEPCADVSSTTPAIRALKRASPGRHVTLLGSPRACAIASRIPEIDATIRYDAPWARSDAPSDVVGDRLMCTALALRRFDAAVVFSAYGEDPLPAAYLCYLAGIPLRLARCRENPYRLLTDWIPEEAGRDEAERQLDLVRAVEVHDAV